MNTLLFVIFLSVALIAALLIVWSVTARNARRAHREELRLKEDQLARLDAALRASEAEKVRQEGEAQTARQLLESERTQHEKLLGEVRENYAKALKEMKEAQEKALEAARDALALQNEKQLKEREASLKKAAAETL